MSRETWCLSRQSSWLSVLLAWCSTGDTKRKEKSFRGKICKHTIHAMPLFANQNHVSFWFCAGYKSSHLHRRWFVPRASDVQFPVRSSCRSGARLCPSGRISRQCSCCGGSRGCSWRPRLGTASGQTMCRRTHLCSHKKCIYIPTPQQPFNSGAPLKKLLSNTVSFQLHLNTNFMIQQIFTFTCLEGASYLDKKSFSVVLTQEKQHPREKKNQKHL